jgi:hypothetical protein
MKGVNHYTREGKLYSGRTHKKANGQLHSGAAQGKSSKRLYHYRELSKPAQARARTSWGK